MESIFQCKDSENTLLLRAVKKLTSLFLSLIMVGSPVADSLVTIAYADTLSDTAELIATVNGVDKSALFTNNLTICYGDVVSLYCDGYDTATDAGLQFAYAAPSSDDEQMQVLSGNILDTKSIPLGNYRLYYAFTRVGSETTTIQNITKPDSGFTLVPAKLSTPNNLHWNGTTASWSPVTQSTTSTASLDGDAIGNYTVKLFQNGVLVDTKQVSATDCTYDYSGFFSEDALKFGEYTFSVTAISGNSHYYTSDVATSDNHSHADYVAPQAVAIGRDESTISQMKTTATDGVGVVAYQFTTAATVGSLDSGDWMPISETKVAKITAKATAAGTWYAYVKDAAGNIGQSTGIPVSTVEFHNYYDNSETSSERTEYLIGNADSFALSEVMTVRLGYAFEGWYDNAIFTGDPVLTATVSTTDLYAKWSTTVISVTLTDYCGTYDGAQHSLTASIQSADGLKTTWEWYRNNTDSNIGGTPVSSVSGTNYPVCHVDDSDYYYAVATVIRNGNTETYTTDPVGVSISPATLTPNWNTAGVEGYYETDLSPQFLTGSLFSGFKGTDTVANIQYTFVIDSLTYTNLLDASATPYVVTIQDFSADHNDYVLPVAAGSCNVTVKPLPVSDGVELTAELEDATWTFVDMETAHEPEVSVYIHGNLISDTDYDVVYSDNIEAGTASATITLKGNYKGSCVRFFTIQKATFTPELSISTHEYDGHSQEAVLVSNLSGGEATIYYQRANNNDGVYTPKGSATRYPYSDAGDYVCYVVISETDNYEKITSDYKGFSIPKKTITITANSGSWEYDGNTHLNPGYLISGTLVGSDSFANIPISGSIQNVGTATNAIGEVTFSQSTNTANYKLVLVNGVLTVTRASIGDAFGLNWSAAASGKATWSAISREQLVTLYDVSLYRKGNPIPLQTATDCADTEMDFSSAIKSDTLSNGAGTYYFTVQAHASLASTNYNPTKTNVVTGSEIHTALVTVSPTSAATHIVAGLNAECTDHVCVLMSGDTASIYAVHEVGYELAKPAWYSDSVYVSLSNNEEANTTIVAGKLTEPKTVMISAYDATDEVPVIHGFTADYKTGTDLQTVTLTMHATDSLGITAYAITTTPTPSNVKWTDAEINQTEFILDVIPAGIGTYYGFVKDSAGNIVRSDSIGIYKIEFEPGKLFSTGTKMHDILKIENHDIFLPELLYSFANYSFQNWKGSSGNYGDEALYSANCSETLEAQWTNIYYTYTIQYFIMDTDGSYPVSPTQVATYKAAGGTTITSAGVPQLRLSGFELDTDKAESLTLSKNDVLHVYYLRHYHKLTYQYTNPATDELVSTYTNVYVGGSVKEPDSPSVVGYTFLGWNYGNDGSKPASMPSHDVTATGAFVPGDAKYQLDYYIQTLDGHSVGNAYTLYTTITNITHHGENISGSITDENVLEIPGFTVSTVGIGTGATSPVTTAAQTTASTSEIKHIAYYYTRNQYTLSLAVWYGAPSDPSSTIHSTLSKSMVLYYGETVPTGYSVISESSLPNGYRLANYTDWSTGEEPATMPASDATATRELVLNDTQKYYIELFMQGAVGTYPATASKTITEEATYGYIVGVEGSTPPTGVEYNKVLSVSNIMKMGGYSQHAYTYVPTETNAVNYASVAVDGSTHLKLYFARNEFTTALYYYEYEDGIGHLFKKIEPDSNGNAVATYYDENDLMVNTETSTLQLKGIWGSSMTYYPLDEFGIDGTDTYWSDNYTARVSTANYQVNNPYSNYNFDTVEKIEDKGNTALSYYFGTVNHNDSSPHRNQIVIYYTKRNLPTEPDLRTVDVMYNFSNLIGLPASQRNHYVAATYLVEGKERNIRIANDVAMYNDPYAMINPSKTNALYPGLAYTPENIIWTHTDLKSTVSIANISGTDYYYDNDYVYLVVTQNNLYNGNIASYTIPGGSIAHKDAIAQLKDYQEKCAANTYEDDSAPGRDLYNTSWSQSIAKDQGVNPLVMTYNLVHYGTLYHQYNDHVCDGHIYALGHTLSKSEMENCGTLSNFVPLVGFTKIWYLNNKIIDPDSNTFTFSSSEKQAIIKGAYSKTIVQNDEYVFYQQDDRTYVTIAECDNLKTASGTTITKVVTSTITSLKDGLNRPVTDTVITETYSINGKTVAIHKNRPALCYTEISMDYLSYGTGMIGYAFDSSNTNNILAGYVQGDGIILQVFFARKTHSIEEIPLLDKAETLPGAVPNSIIRPSYFGETVLLPDFSGQRNGYTFDGWKLETKTDADISYTFWKNVGKTESFIMPESELRATAIWTAAPFDVEVTSFYPDGNGDLHASVLEQIRSPLVTSETDTVRLDKVSKTGTVYKIVDTVLTVKIGNYYYAGMASPTEIASTDCIAKQEYKHLSSDQIYPIDVFSDSNLSNYQYSYSQVTFPDGNTQSVGDFTAEYGLFISNYFSPKTYEVGAKVLDSDNTVINAKKYSINGTGIFNYGGKGTLYFELQSAGYTFNGWYGEDDTSYAECLSTATSLPFVTTKDTDYVALLDPNPITGTISVSGKTGYDFGSEAANKNTLQAIVSGLDAGTYVDSYSWSRKTGLLGSWDDLDKHTANLQVPADQKAGTYYYKVTVHLINSENGTSKDISETFTVTIKRIKNQFSVAGYTGVYDGAKHQVFVSTPSKFKGSYDLYYSVVTQLDINNYNTVGIKGVPSATNVGESGSYYWYIQSGDDNYDDMSGGENQVTIDISPKDVTVRSKKAYSKVFDGSVYLDATETNSICHTDEYIVLEGVISDDEVILEATEAQYNTPHYMADKIYLSGITLTGAESENYYVAKSTAEISAYITARALTIDWDATGLVYDATAKSPTAVIHTTGISALDTVLTGKLSVSGEQTNAGSYKANATLSTTPVVDVIDGNVITTLGYYSGDYLVSNVEQNYTIAKRPVVFELQTETIIYDGSSHTLEATVHGEVGVTDSDLVAGHVSSYKTDKYYRDVVNNGQVNVISTGYQAVQIYDSANTSTRKNVTDNYAITCLPATLTIQPKTVAVSGGITAADKTYDGKTNATVTMTDATFTGLIPGETVTVEGITGVFEDAFCTATVTDVILDYSAAVLKGSDAKNYVISSTDCQNTAKATINKALLTLKASDASKTYNKSPLTSGAYTITSGSLITPDTITNLVMTDGSTIQNAGTQPNMISPSSIVIKHDTKDVTDCYQITTDNGSLTVSPKNITVTSKTSADQLVKEYDGTTGGTPDNNTTAKANYALVGLEAGDDVIIPTGTTVTITYNDRTLMATKATVVYSSTALTGTDAKNYTLTNNSYSLNAKINQKAVTLKADAKTVTYGDDKPTLTVQVVGGGLGTGDTISQLISVSCDYVKGNNVGSYPITLATKSDNNYLITLKDNSGADQPQITVNKKVLTVISENKTMTYGSDVPTFTRTVTGWYTGESSASKTSVEALIDAAIDMSCKTASSTDVISLTNVGTYTIQLVTTSDIVLDNYKVTIGSNGQLNINAKTITLDTKISASDVTKVYDGTTGGTSANRTTSKSQWVINGTVAGDVVSLSNLADSNFTVTYNNSTVAGTSKATVSVADNSINNANYTLGSDKSFELTASVTRAPLTITGKDFNVVYGTAKTTAESNMNYTVSGYVHSETTSILKGSVSYSYSTVTYTNTMDVGTVIKYIPNGLSTDNYTISYDTGSITVTKNQFTMSNPTWKSSNPGTIEWTNPMDIGAVSVDGFTVSLFKNGGANPVTVTNVPATATSVDFADTIRTNGVGAYTVKVMAQSADTDNVLDSAEAGSGTLYAALVEAKYKDASGYTGVIKDKMEAAAAGTITVNGITGSDVLISGEQVSLIANMASGQTGYTISAAGTTTVTISGGTQNASENYRYEATLSATLTSSATQTVWMTLTPRSVTGQVRVSKTNIDPIVFNYTEAKAPVFEAFHTVDPVDTITGTGYTYSYDWKLQQTFTYESINPATPTSTIKLATGYPAGTAYVIRCDVTATRNDNGMTKTFQPQTGNPHQFHFSINRAKLTDESTFFTPSDITWTYGDLRPNLADCITTPSASIPEFYYRSTAPDNRTDYDELAELTVANGWTPGIPTEAGDYYITAYVKEDSNYSSFVLKGAVIHILKATLGTATNISLENPSEATKAVYGDLKWTAVPAIQENMGFGGTSRVNPKYDLELLYSTTLSAGYQVIASASNITGTDYDFGEYIDKIGFYKARIKAYPVNTPSSLDNANPGVTAESDSLQVLHIADAIAADCLNKVYDGQPITLTAPEIADTIWYKDGIMVASTSDNILTVSDVADSGVYTCVQSKSYAIAVTITIERCPVTITWDNGISGAGKKVYTDYMLTVPVCADTTSTNLMAADNVELHALGAAQKVVSNYTATVTLSGTSLKCNNYEIVTSTDHLASYNWSIEYLVATASDSGTHVNDDWYTGDVTLTPPAGMLLSTTRSGWQPTLTYTADGHHTVNYYIIQSATDYQTNINSISFDIDKNGATGIIFGNGGNVNYVSQTQPDFYQNELKVTATATDATSGLATLEYQIINKGESMITNGTWTSLPAKGITFNPKAETKVAIRMTDKAGNVSYQISNDMVVYENVTNVVTSLNYTKTTLANQKASVTLNGNTVKEIRNGSTILSATDYHVATNGDITFKGVFLDTLAAGNHTLTVIYNPMGYATSAPISATDIIVSVHKHTGTISTTDVSYGKIYDGTPVVLPGVTSTNTLGVSNSNVEYEYKGTTDPDSSYAKILPTNAGQYVVKATVKEDDNYQSAFTIRAFTITPCNITVSAENKSKEYGSSDPVWTYVITGKPASGTDIINIGCTRTVGEIVGTYTITPKETVSSNPNYSMSMQTATMTVVPRPVSIVWDSSNLYLYTKALRTITAHADNTVGSDTVGFTYKNATATEVGSYTAMVATLDNANYTLVSATNNVFNWAIEYLSVTNVATVVGDTKNTSGWYTGNVKLMPPASYTISTDTDNWLSELPVTGEGLIPKHYYLRNSIGEITNQLSKDVLIDTENPTLTSLKTKKASGGGIITIEAKDITSGVESISITNLPTFTSIITYTDTTFTISGTSLNVEYPITILIKDVAGNEVLTSTNFKIKRSGGGTYYEPNAEEEEPVQKYEPQREQTDFEVTRGGQTNTGNELKKIAQTLTVQKDSILDKMNVSLNEFIPMLKDDTIVKQVILQGLDQGNILIHVKAVGLEAEMPNKSAVADAVLTPEDYLRVVSGDIVEIRLEIEKRATEELSEKEIKAIQIAAGEEKTIYYMDLSMYKILSDKTKEKIDDFTKPIRVTMEIPREIMVRNGSYQLVVCHEMENKIETLILEDQDKVSNTITVDVDKLCTGAIIVTRAEHSEPCFWHLITAGIGLLAAILLIMLRKHGKAMGVIAIISILAAIATTFMGHCRWDIIVLIATAAVIILLLLLLSRNDDGKKEKTAGEQQ